MNHVLSILVKARSIIERPQNWCRRYSEGNAICAVHALQKAWAGMNLTSEVEVDAYRALGTAMGVKEPENGPMMGNWNDTHTHAEVLAAFDRAIESTRALVSSHQLETKP